MKTLLLILSALLIASLAHALFVRRSNAELTARLAEAQGRLAEASRVVAYYEQTAKELTDQLKEADGRDAFSQQIFEARVRLDNAQMGLLRAQLQEATKRTSTSR